MSGSWASPTLETGQNAISSLLQPPIVRTGLLPRTSAPTLSAQKPPTIRDIPPVTLTSIAHIDPTEFTPYLTQVGALYEQLQAVKESENKATDIFHKRGSKTGDSAAVSDDDLWPGQSASVPRPSSISSEFSFSPIGAPSQIRRYSSGGSRKAIQELSPLSAIPSVYFDEDFHLENPRTFDVVSERSEIIQPPTVTLGKMSLENENTAVLRKPLSTNAILQDKLSWYMDIIEIYLIASVLTASTTFFIALSSLQELHSETTNSVARIKALRRELEVLDREIAISGLNIVQTRQRQENLQQLRHAVIQLSRITDGVATCESLIDNGEIETALESIGSLENLIAGELDHPKSASKFDRRDLQLRDLRGTIMLQGVNNDLSTLRFRIGKVYEARFLSLLIGDLQRHAKVVSTQEVLIRWANASERSRGSHIRESSIFPSYMGSTEDLRSELLESLTGLHRVKHLITAATAYREAALKEIRNLIRRSLPSSNDDDNDSLVSSSTMQSAKTLSQHQKLSILARNLRALGPRAAETLLVTIYIRITETLRRLTTQIKLLLDVASSLGDGFGSSGSKSQTELSLTRLTVRVSPITAAEIQEIHKAIGLPDLLGQSVDIAQDKIAKILRVRSEQSTHLSLVWFLRYFTLNLHFVNECESISGRSGATLKTVVNGQIKDFVQHFSDVEKEKLARNMESEQWEAKDFSEKDTANLNRILSCSTKDPTEWLDDLKIWIPPPDNDLESSGPDDPQPNSNSMTRIRNAYIDEETFILPNPAILCMDSLARFLQLIASIPSMTSDISASLVSYLQFFNSRCTQLILGAGARRSAGLKNITSKHLVLASQALAFIAALISYVREFVRRHAGSGAATLSVVEFDKVKRLYQEHQSSINDKIVEIMSRLAASHVKAMRNTDWDNGQKNAHSYMVALTKDTTSLHRILTKNLPEQTVRRLMTPVFISYKDQFSKAFKEEDPKTELGRDSMLHDVEFFQSKLGKIDGYGDTGEYLNTIIKSKQLGTHTPGS
ncbi:vacuolar sorting protein [Nemania sp. FL0031]|nr:vacuolar sorting protein [Nemania sp. FL0031]